MVVGQGDGIFPVVGIGNVHPRHRSENPGLLDVAGIDDDVSRHGLGLGTGEPLLQVVRDHLCIGLALFAQNVAGDAPVLEQQSFIRNHDLDQIAVAGYAVELVFVKVNEETGVCPD